MDNYSYSGKRENLCSKDYGNFVIKVALLFTLGIIIMGFNFSKLNTKDDIINATIVKLSTSNYSAEYTGEIDKYVYVDYTYNGNNYSSVKYTDNFNSTWKVGDTIPVLLNSEGSLIRAYECTGGEEIGFVIGSLIVLYSIIYCVKYLQNMKNSLKSYEQISNYSYFN